MGLSWPCLWHHTAGTGCCPWAVCVLARSRNSPSEGRTQVPGPEFLLGQALSWLRLAGEGWALSLGDSAAVLQMPRFSSSVNELFALLSPVL